jgi:hypothetical protein
MPARRDWIDQECERWADVARQLWGVSEPRLSRDVLGPLSCTLGARRDLHAGSKSAGRVDQAWPEFPYVGRAWMVNEAYKAMDPELRAVMAVRYVFLRPKSPAARAEIVGWKVRPFQERLGRVKAFVEGRLAAEK